MKTPRCSQDTAQVAMELGRWYGGVAGRRLLADVKEAVDPLLPDLFGFYALQVGAVSPQVRLLQNSPIKHCCVLGLPALGADVAGEADALPFERDSLDLVLLLHALEFSPDPHAILREVDRTLIPEGHLIVVGFNPVSFYGLWNLLLRSRGRAPWCGRFFTGTRIVDWISLLGFDILATSYAGYRPPLQHSTSRQLPRVAGQGVHTLFRGLGGVHIHLARKRVATLAPVKRAWRPRPALVPGGIAEPTARNSRHD